MHAVLHSLCADMKTHLVKAGKEEGREKKYVSEKMVELNPPTPPLSLAAYRQADKEVIFH